METHGFPNVMMRYSNTPVTPTSPFGRTRLPPYATAYGDLSPAAAWANATPAFDSNSKSYKYCDY